MNVVLVQPEIPPNTGNVARLCAATGATLHLVGPLGFRLDDATLKRAGMDYWEHVQWKYWGSWAELQKSEAESARRRCEVMAIGRQNTEEKPTFYFVENETTRLYTQPRYRWGDYLVFGRETAGLPEELLRTNPDNVIAIPMWNPKARSLNLATAVAIVLYEAMRQVRGF